MGKFLLVVLCVGAIACSAFVYSELQNAKRQSPNNELLQEIRALREQGDTFEQERAKELRDRKRKEFAKQFDIPTFE